jgi:small subunit ribosomal protein S2
MNKELNEEVVQTNFTPSIDYDEVIKIKFHFGQKKSARNASMCKHIFATKSGVDIINLNSIVSSLDRVAKRFYEIGKKKERVLCVTRSDDMFGEVMKQFALKCGFFYVISNWRAGTFTNSQVVIKSAKNELKRYSEILQNNLYKKKREAVLIKKRMSKLNSTMVGISEMNQAPQVLFIQDTEGSSRAVISEANKCGIEVISICDSNSLMNEMIDLAIIANNDSPDGLQYIFDVLCDAYFAGVKDYMKDKGFDLDSIVAQK